LQFAVAITVIFTVCTFLVNTHIGKGKDCVDLYCASSWTHL